MSGIGSVVVVGSINADSVVEVAELPGPEETVVGDRISQRHGGKGANQAVAAARAGAVVAIVGAVESTRRPGARAPADGPAW